MATRCAALRFRAENHFVNAPARINSASFAKSVANTRSCSIFGLTLRMAACALCNGRLVLSGDRKSSACAAAQASIASTLVVFAITRYNLIAAVIPMDT
jgi:hypothetical protein